jgi:hypothetical protein
MQYALDEDIINSIASFGPNQNAYRKDVFQYTQKAVDLCSGSNNSNNTISTQCGVGSYRSGNRCNVCTDKPSNTHYTNRGTCDWTCNTGYSRSGNSCIKDYTNNFCSAGQYSSGNTCYSCGSVPVNGYYTTTNSCNWSCNSGYYKSGNTCVSNNNNNNNINNINNCSIGQYISGNSCYTCNSRPSNSYYTSANSCDWTCNSGYYKSGNSCVSNYNNNTSCSLGQYSSGNSCFNCATKPSYAYYTSVNSCDWNCES